MFTGIIEEVGEVASLTKKGRSAVLSVKCSRVREDARLGDSIAVDGVCMTVTKMEGGKVFFDLSGETLDRSTVRFLKKGGRVNLERAARLGDRIGGHLVSGHVDGVGKITAKKKAGSGVELRVELSRELTRYLVEKGSVAVDGISLTVAKCRGNQFTVALIPHTLNATTLKDKGVGAPVNIECDQVGKYIEKFLGQGQGKGDRNFEHRMLNLEL